MFKKITFLLFVSFVLVSCWENTQLSNESNIVNEKTMVETTEAEDNYWDLSDFIDPNLSEEQAEELLVILGERKQRQSQIQLMLKKAKIEWNFDVVFENVVAIRKTCANRIVPYVSADKKESFLTMCESWNDKLKQSFMNQNTQNTNHDCVN